MDFNTLIFLGFFAGTAVVYYALPKVLKPLFLLAASYCFYLYKPENARLVTLLISATVITWCSGLAIAASRKLWVRRLFLCIAALTCGGILFFYKYFNFFNSVLWGERATLLDLSAPLGLSYFTFQSLSYTLDIYQKKLSITPCLSAFSPASLPAPSSGPAIFCPSSIALAVFPIKGFPAGPFVCCGAM